MSKAGLTFRGAGGVSRMDPVRLEAADELGRKMVQGTASIEVRNELRKFNATGNGVHAWRAYALARSAGLPIHPDVLAYLDECASAATQGSSPMTVVSMMRLSNVRGGARVQRAACITDHQHMQLLSLAMAYLHCPKGGKKAARNRVAEQYGTTEGSLYQLWRRATKAGPL